MPSINEPDKRSKWIEAIKAHQYFNTEINRFYVCRKHFTEDCFKPNCKTVQLKLNAIPTLFNKQVETVETTEIIPNSVTHNNDNNTQIEHAREVDELKRKIFQLEMKNNVEAQAWEMKLKKSNALTERYLDDINEMQKKIQEESMEKQRLIETLKKLPHLNPENSSTLNVIF